MRCRYWFRRRVTAAIFIQCVWRKHNKWKKKKLWATLKVQKTFRTHCAFNIFTDAKRFFIKHTYQQWKSMSVVCKVAYKHYCLCYAVWQNQTLSLEIVVAQTGRKYAMNITLLNLVEILENDHELYFKAVTFDQLFTRICEHWIDFRYQLENGTVRELQKTYEYSKLLISIKNACTSVTGYPLSQLKANGDI